MQQKYINKQWCRFCERNLRKMKEFLNEKCFTSEEKVNLLQMSNSETLKLIQKMVALVFSSKEQNDDFIKLVLITLKKIIWLTELLLEDMEREKILDNLWCEEDGMDLNDEDDKKVEDILNTIRGDLM